LTLTSTDSVGNLIIQLYRGDGSVVGADFWYDNASGDLYLDNRYDHGTGNIYFRTRINGTPINVISITGSGAATFGGTLAVTGGFGCNGQAAQTAYASGGALVAYATGAFGLDSDANMSALHALVVAMRAALVADGIMS